MAADPCGHLICVDCSKSLLYNTCPVCRTHYTKLIKIYNPAPSTLLNIIERMVNTNNNHAEEHVFNNFGELY